MTMFKKDDKVKVVKGIKAFEGLTGTVLDTNGNQVKVKLNLSDDAELQKNLINVFEAYQLELESLDLLKEDSVSFDNDVEQDKKICCICGQEYEGYGNNAEPYKEGYCCDECNKKFVIPSRLKKLKNIKEGYTTNTETAEQAIKLYRTEPNVEGVFFGVDTKDGFVSYVKTYHNNTELQEINNQIDKSFPNHGTVWCAHSDYVINEIEKELKNKLNSKNESLKLTEQELKAWCSDNDANYYTQDIKDDKVIIRGINEDLAEYNFKTKELKVFDYSGTTVDENELDEAEDDDNYIRDYVYDIDMEDEKTEIPSWEFVSVIATAEDTTEDAVVTEAHDRGFKVFIITASNYEKLVVASEKITEQDIMDDFAAYLEGNPKVSELI